MVVNGLIIIIISENPGNIEVTDKDKLIAKVGVTVDGTWHKREHSSKMGVVFVLSIDTDEVLIMTFVVCSVIMKEKVKPLWNLV